MLPRQRSIKPLNLIKGPNEKSKVDEENKKNSSFAFEQKEVKLPAIQFSGKKDRKSEYPLLKKIIPLQKKHSEQMEGSHFKTKSIMNSPQQVTTHILQNEHDGIITEILKEEEQIIQHHKQLLSLTQHLQPYEHQMLEKIDNPGSSVEEYIDSLEKIIGNKKKHLLRLESKVIYFKSLIQKEKQIYSQIQHQSSKKPQRESTLFEEESEELLNKENFFI